MFARTPASHALRRALKRSMATEAGDRVKILVVGGGSAGLTVSNQLYNTFQRNGRKLNPGDVTIVDGSEWHHYQPGWTLVGSGLKSKTELRRPLEDLVPDHIGRVAENVASFSPKSSSVTTVSGRKISYDALVVAAGIQINWSNIEGLTAALADSNSGVSSIYSYDTCDKVWNDISTLRTGTVVFTQPQGVIKCAGAPQKIMWMAWDYYQQQKLGDNVKVEFWNGMPTMFSVKKYSEALDALRKERDIRGEFGHNLVKIDAPNRKATFKKSDGSTVDTDYTLLHVTPQMGPFDFIKKSELADSAGWVDVDPNTLQHKNPEFKNVFSLGDASSLPTSKTAAAITSQAPVLTHNLYHFLNNGQVGNAAYDGYTSCPLLTGYGQLMLAEFKYGLEPKETFGQYVDQAKPSQVFYYLKKDFFPYVYYDRMVKGEWYGPKGVFRPEFA